MKISNWAVIGGLWAALLSGAGCRHVPELPANGQSSFKFVDPPVGPPRVTASEPVDQVEQANIFEAQLQVPAALPVYPARALKARTIPYSVGVHITVGTNGQVTDLRTSLLAFSTPGPFADDFRNAVEAAVRRWRFTPARAEYFEIIHDGTATYSRATKTEQVETEFDLAFTFRTDGRVELGK